MMEQVFHPDTGVYGQGVNIATRKKHNSPRLRHEIYATTTICARSGGDSSKRRCFPIFLLTPTRIVTAISRKIPQSSILNKLLGENFSF